MDQLDGHYAYKAFITYSHRDTAWAKWLLDALEGYRLPAYLRENLGRRRGVGRIFRDRDEAGAANDLTEEIRKALFSSEHLIVIASPNAARSRYVESEIQAFAEHNLTREIPGCILTLIVAGEPGISPPQGGMAAAECFPAALRGGLTKPDGTPIEPLAADARQTGDGKTRALAKLVSGLLNVRYDMLVRRDLQRRRRTQSLAVAAIVVAFIIAGAVAAILTKNNIDRQSAERSFNTVTAVNNAERARSKFARGAFADAVKLARKGIPDDGSLPFIPQAYSVLYSALFEVRGSMLVDFLAPDESMGGHTFEMANGQFFTVDGLGSAKIWSNTNGIIFTRNDLDVKPATMSPDGSVVFVQPIGSMLRYHADTGRWDKIDPTGFTTDDPNILDNMLLEPQTYVAINANTLAGCAGTILRVISLPKEGGIASLLWTRKLDGFLCNVLEATPQGTLMVAGSNKKVFEIDLKTHQFLHEYQIDDLSTLWSRSAGDAVVVSGTSTTYVFDRESTKLILSFKDTGAPDLLSDGGRYIIEPGILSGAGGIVVHDVKEGVTARPPCQNCSVIGFLDESTMIALGSDQQHVQLFDTVTGAPKAGGFAFSDRIDRAQIFSNSKTLLGLRSSSQTLVTVLGQKSADPTVLAGRSGKFMVSAMFAGANTIVSEVSEGTQNAQTTLHLYHAIVRGEEIAAPELNSAGGFAKLTRLPERLFSAFATDSITETTGSYRIFDADTGQLVLKKSVKAPPILFGSSRYLLLADEEDFGVFDLKSRNFKPLSAGIGAGLGKAWSVNSNFLATAVGPIIRLFSLSEDGAQPKITLTADAPPINICVTLDGKYVYAADYTSDPPILHRILVSDGKENARLVMNNQDETEKDLARVLQDAIIPGAEKRSSIACDDERVVIQDEFNQMAAVWMLSEKVQKMRIMPLAVLDPPPLPERESINESLVSDQIGSVVFTYSDTRLSLRDPVTQLPLMTITPEASRIASAVWVRSRGLIAAGLDNGRLQVWNATNASATMIDLAAHGESIEMLDASADGKWLLTGDRGGTIKLWPMLTTSELLKQDLTSR